MAIKSTVYRIVITQFAVTFLATTLCLTVDWLSARSALLGGLTCAVPSAFMAWYIGREVAQPGTALAYLVRGELSKLTLTAVMFTVVFLWVKPLYLAFYFMALVLALGCNIFVPMVEARKAMVAKKN